MLQASLKSVLGWVDKKSWRFVSACEIDRQCCEILMQKLPSTCCCFNDIFEAFPGWNHSLGPSPTVHERWQALCGAWRGDLHLRCQAHGGSCKQRGSSIDVTGSPCQPWSRSGNHGKTDDRRFDVTLAYLSRILHLQPLIAIHENVKGFQHAAARQP